MKRWYVAYTHARAEATALGHLQRQGFTAYLPRFLKHRRHARKVERVPAPMFPRYLFVEMNVSNSRWRSVLSTVGVSHLVCQGDAPTPLPSDVVEEMRGREDDNGFVVMNRPELLRRGDRVRIEAGAFCDHVGLFDCTTDDKRLVILLNLLGRQVKARVPADFVCACA